VADATSIAKSTGRVFRGLLATAALGTLAFITLLMLSFSCCSSPSLGTRISQPEFWYTILSMPVAIASFPWVSKRLRPSPLRWLLAPCVAATGLYWMAIVDLGAGDKAVLFAAAPVLCAIYVIARVLFARRRSTQPS
jgi:hypothetical protein